MFQVAVCWFTKNGEEGTFLHQWWYDTGGGGYVLFSFCGGVCGVLPT